MSGRVLITLLAALAFAGVAAPAHADVQVTVTDSGFSPAQVTITEGETVTWVFAQGGAHSVTSEVENDSRGSFDSDFDNRAPNHPAGDKFSHNFEFEGTYEYFCKVHPDKRGRVIVLPRRQNPNPPPVDVSPPKFSSKKLSLRKKRFTFRLNETAAVTAKLRGPTRRTRRFQGRVGRNTFKLPKRMRPGRYSIMVTATDESHNVRRYTLRFRVRKRG